MRHNWLEWFPRLFPSTFPQEDARYREGGPLYFTNMDLREFWSMVINWRVLGTTLPFTPTATNAEEPKWWTPVRRYWDGVFARSGAVRVLGKHKRVTLQCQIKCVYVCVVCVFVSRWVPACGRLTSIDWGS